MISFFGRKGKDRAQANGLSIHYTELKKIHQKKAANSKCHLGTKIKPFDFEIEIGGRVN